MGHDVARVRWPFGLHVGALAVVLVIGLLVVHPGNLQQADEGAAVAQAARLAAGDGWGFEHPFPTVDPEGRAFSFELSSRIAGTDRHVVFEKHAVYPVLLAVAYDLGGVPGTLAVSMLGTLVAAVGAALVARRLDPSLDRVTLWSVGVGSPLLFDGYQAIAHTLGAAGVAIAVASVLARDRSLVVRAVGAAVSVAGAVLMRNEAVLLAGALGVGVAVRSWRAHRWVDALLVPVVWGAGATAALVDRVLSARLIGSTEVTAFRTPVGGSFFADRVDAFRRSVLAVADTDGLASSVGWGAVGCLAVGAILLRNPPHRGATLVLAGGVLVVARAVIAPHETVPGLLAAFPVLVLGTGLVDRARLRDPEVACLATTAVGFALAVAATQYANAGGGGWGGRYFAIGLPVFAPLAWDAVRRAVVATPAAGPTRRRVSAGLVLATAGLGAHALVAMRIQHDWTARLTAQVVVSASDDRPGDGDDRPVILTTSGALARLSWAEVDGGRWLTVAPDDLPRYAARLQAAGVRTVTFASASPRAELATLSPYYLPVGDPVAPQVTVPWRGPRGFGLFVVELRAVD